jgi:hypothetical protein
MGANYVQIVRMVPEHMAGLCLDRAFLIDGTAYRVQPRPGSRAAATVLTLKNTCRPPSPVSRYPARA